MSDYSDLEYAMANDQEAVYELTDLVAEQEETISSLREQVKVLREACETAKECLDNNGLGKAYVQDFLNEALSQPKPKEAKL